ncbi:hypothetical protein EMCG_06953 [[Emmonsia] crescens]|uniref:Plastocyanin-like domain-containing protein n=1 Tax=[Emmonsia] crescens TaxID=73230 RepID=A0A0G2IAS6_9EURO|nr:hypothetical protein EMCG_06953 [Emmonsia crescens UAMH 3008]
MLLILLLFIVHISIVQVEPAADQSVTHRVRVGSPDGHLFEPNQLNANVGDKVIFEFKGDYTLTGSSLERPCIPLAGASGFTGRTGLTLLITVYSSQPQWFFCWHIDSISHCHAGMVFALNPGDEMDEFLARTSSDTSSATCPCTTTVISTTRVFYPGSTGGPRMANATCVPWATGGPAPTGMGAGAPTGTTGMTRTGTPMSPTSVTFIPFTGKAGSSQPEEVLSLLLTALLGVALS